MTVLLGYPYTSAVLQGSERWALVDEDCSTFLSKLPECSIDAIVTDPPAGVGFMNKDWDDPRKWDAFRRARNPNDAGRDNVFGRAANHAPHSYGESDRDVFVTWLAEIMRECHRVLKPGGHALVWALPRTSHWTATAIEDAGFEIRDVILHLFGSGFPKNLDVSKAIDKKIGAVREVIGTKLGLPDGSLMNPEKECAITASATEEAKKWNGWGTALKPASEHWILARKPLEKGLTVAENVLKWSTGALNIDGCRIASPSINTARRTGNVPKLTSAEAAALGRIADFETYAAECAGEQLGRWPANLVLSHADDCELVGDCGPDCPVAELDRQSGASTSRVGKPRQSKKPSDGWGMTKTGAEYNDKGGASRFFYVAKASRKEREAGLDALTSAPKNAVYGNGLNSATKVRTKEQAENGVDRGALKNVHPTVKPIDLLRYLCRLITPPNGIVLDPFAGSGSTGCAALLEGFRFIGVEQEAEYCRIATARIAYWENRVCGLGPLRCEPADSKSEAEQDQKCTTTHHPRQPRTSPNVQIKIERSN